MSFDDEEAPTVPPLPKQPGDPIEGGDAHESPARDHDMPAVQSEVPPAAHDDDHGYAAGPAHAIPPHEEHVLACCFLDGETTDPQGAPTYPSLTRARQDGITTDHFSHPSARRIFFSLLTLQSQRAPLTIATAAQALGPQADWQLLLQLTDASKYPTTAHYSHYLRILKEEHLRRQLSSVTSLIADRIQDDPQTLAAQIMQRLQQATRTPQAKTHPARPLFTLSIPPANDPSSILGNRYLNKGDGAVLSSSSGMGKSAAAIQAGEAWSLGEDFVGIRPSRPLRILYIQSEDSDGDVAEVTASIRHVRQRTPEQVATVNRNFHIVTDRTNRGQSFLAQLRLHIAAHTPDLVIINPLQAFIDGDVTDSQDLGAFLREGLNSLNEPAQFAYLLIHHTTKPATGKERNERLWHEVMYDMAGGAELINWARAILSLRATPTEGEFNLVLAKRGRRAGVTKEVSQGAGTRQEPVTSIPLKHAKGFLPSGQPLIYWEPRATPDATEPKATGAGRPPSHHFTDYRSVFPTAMSQGLPLNQLHRVLTQQRPINKDALFRALKRWAADGEVEIVPDPGKTDRYRAAL